MEMTKGFIMGALIAIMAACTPMDLIRSPEPEPISAPLTRPDVSVYVADDGGICFSEQDATNFFLYVNELEMNQ